VSDAEVAATSGLEMHRVAYSPSEVAELVGLSRKAIYRAIERGELAASRVSSRLRIRPADIDSWLEAGRIETSATVAPPLPLAGLPSRGAVSLRRVLDEFGPG
jgi:excisionase family DNA binding protein